MTHGIFTNEEHRTYLLYPNEASAQADLPRVEQSWPGAFVFLLPPGPPQDWDIDFPGKSITLSSSKKADREAKEKQDRLSHLAKIAYNAELNLLVDIDTGNTPEAKAYQAAKAAP